MVSKIEPIIKGNRFNFKSKNTGKSKIQKLRLFYFLRRETIYSENGAKLGEEVLIILFFNLRKIRGGGRESE